MAILSKNLKKKSFEEKYYDIDTFEEHNVRLIKFKSQDEINAFLKEAMEVDKEYYSKTVCTLNATPFEEMKYYHPTGDGNWNTEDVYKQKKLTVVEIIEYEMPVETKKTFNVGGKVMKSNKMNFGGMMKGMNMRQLDKDEVGMGFDGHTYFKRKDGDYVRYDKETESIINTHDMKFDFGMVMIIPSPTIVVGDMIVKDSGYISVTKLTKNRIFGVSLNTGRVESIVMEKSAIGFNFYQKVVNVMDGQNATGMFGGINPMMLMMMSDDEGDGNDMMKNIMMMQAFGGMNGQTPMPFAPQQLQPVADGDEKLTPAEIDAEIERLQTLKG